MTTTPYKFEKDTINPDVLDQVTHWYDSKGNLYKITDMSKYHARGAMNKLFRTFGAQVIGTPVYSALQKRWNKASGYLQ